MRRSCMLRVLFALLLAWAVAPGAVRANDFLGKTAKQWVDELKDGKTPQARRGAAFALGKLGFAGSPGVPYLVEALADPNAGIRDAAAYALGEIGTALGEASAATWRDAGAGLTKLLTDAEPQVRRSAAFAIGGYGPRAQSAKRALVSAFKDSNPSVRQNAAFAMGKLGTEAASDGVNGLSGLLVDEDAVVRRDAAAALGEIGKPTASSAVRALAECCRRDKDENVRKAALDALVNLAGPEDKASASELTALLTYRDVEVARGAAFALGNIGGREAAGAVPVLRIALRDEDPQVKTLAGAALANIGPDAAPALPELSLAIFDKDPGVRRSAALAFSRIGASAAPAVKTLAQALGSQETESDVRRFSAEALARVGSDVEKVIPNLLGALKDDKDHTVRQRSVWALFQVSDLARAGVVGPLTTVLGETERESLMVRYDAARCLALKMGPGAPEKAVDVLLEMLNDKHIRIYNRTDASVSGGSEGSGGTSKTAPNLGGDARFLAAQALARIGNPKANRPAIIEALKDAAQSPDQRCREESTKALAAIQK